MSSDFRRWAAQRSIRASRFAVTQARLFAGASPRARPCGKPCLGSSVRTRSFLPTLGTRTPVVKVNDGAKTAARFPALLFQVGLGPKFRYVADTEVRHRCQ